MVDVLVSAVGQLSRPSYPDIEGVDTFAGPNFHSAEWDHDVDLTGKRVAVIGTGASAIQFVPADPAQVEHLTVFQRTPPYIIPRPDREFSDLHHKVFEQVPATLLVERGTWYGVIEGLSVAWVYSKPLAAAIKAALEAAHAQADEGEARPVREGLADATRSVASGSCSPTTTCRRSAQPNVDVVTERISGDHPAGVRTADGLEHEADVIIWGTGFKATEFLAPMSIKGARRS